MTRTNGSIQIILHAKVAMDEAVRAAVYQLRDEGHDIQVRVTWEGVDSINFAKQAGESGKIVTVVAGGGDGTVNAVVSGLMMLAPEQRPALGVLPMGTANDFARGCGIPAGDPYAALKLIIDNEAQPIDVGRCQDRYFINVATGGFGTEITVSTDPELKKKLGGAAYLLTGVTNIQAIKARQARFESEDYSWEGSFLAMAVGNARYAGGAVDMCPEAKLDDGLLEVTVMPDVPEPGLGQVLTDLLQTGFEQGLRMHLRTWRTEELRIHAAETMQVNLDGEPLSGTEIHFGIIPSAIRCHLPANSPMRS